MPDCARAGIALANVVKEERPAVGGGEVAGPPRGRSGKGTLLVFEQLASSSVSGKAAH